MYVYYTYMSETMTGRLNFRLTAEQERSLRRAAALTGESVSGFVLSSAVEHAQQVLAEANRLDVSAAEFRRFVADLDKPTKLVPELVALFRRPSRIPGS